MQLSCHRRAPASGDARLAPSGFRIRVVTSSAPPLPPSSARYERVQVLRFFAALGVVLYHANVYLQGRRPDVPAAIRFFDTHWSWGVQLFFVISGFVIAHSIERMSVGEFARRRFLRIYPALWTAAGLVLGVRWLLQGQLPELRDLLPVLTLWPFGGGVYPLGVEWSLVYEIFFYFVVCAAALGGWTRTRDVLCVAWLAAIGIDFALAPARSTTFNPTIGQIFLSAFNVPFIVGMLVHRVHLRIPVAARWIALPCAPALLAASAFVARTQTALLLQGLGFGALILWAVLADRRRALAAGNPLVALGDWSYGLYLVHVPVINYVLAVAAGSSAANATLYVVLVTTAVACGSAFGAVEARFYRWLLRVTRGKPAPAPAKATSG